ncbi:hypothetical protein FQR65_LT17062 [Abscondita terminalis]|nr:hypothetical protein FQR65_LT17062 [Abscondita terminalis]
MWKEENKEVIILKWKSKIKKKKALRYKGSTKKILKLTSVPSQFLSKKKFDKHPYKELIEKRKHRLEKREAARKNISIDVIQTQGWCSLQSDFVGEKQIEHESPFLNLNETEKGAIQGILNLSEPINIERKCEMKTDKSIQVKIGDILTSFSSQMKDESSLFSITS